MQRRFAEYRPVSRWRARLANVRLFRSVQLNRAGWAVVVALLVTGAALGYVGGRLLYLPGALASLGCASIVLSCLVILDRRRNARLR